MEFTISSPLKVEVDTVIPSMDFKEALPGLIASGKKFDCQALQKITYSQLHLCCIGPAGLAACSPRLVFKEKERRLSRYTSAPPEELAASERWMKTEGMYGDVMAEVAAKAAPSWDTLKPRQQIVAKLFCLYNHIDDPEGRVVDAVVLLRDVGGSGLNPMLCSECCSKLVNLSRRYLGIQVEEKDRIGIPEFREGLYQVMEAVLDVLPKEEQLVLVREHIRDYSCTSDCFRSFCS